MSTRTTRWRFLDPVCFQTASISDDDKRSRCHDRITDQNIGAAPKSAQHTLQLIRLSRQDCAARIVVSMLIEPVISRQLVLVPR